MPAETYMGDGATYQKITEWAVGDGAARQDLIEAYMGDGTAWNLIFQKFTGAPQFVSYDSNAQASVTVATTGVVAASSADDILLVACFLQKFGGTLDMVLATAGYTEILRQAGPGNSPELLVAWKRAESIGNHAAAFTFPDALNSSVAMILVISGAHQTAPIHAFNSADGNASSAVAASITPTISGYLGISMLGHGLAGGLSMSGTGWSEIGQDEDPGASGVGMVWGQKADALGASGNVNYTMANVSRYINTQIIIAPP